MTADVSVAEQRLAELLAACAEFAAVSSESTFILIAACTSTAVARCLQRSLQLSGACTDVTDLSLSLRLATAGPLTLNARMAVAECRSVSSACAQVCEDALGTLDVIARLALSARRTETACVRMLGG
jgi:hypothetical protein